MTLNFVGISPPFATMKVLGAHPFQDGSSSNPSGFPLSYAVVLCKSKTIIYGLSNSICTVPYDPSLSRSIYIQQASPSFKISSTLTWFVVSFLTCSAARSTKASGFETGSRSAGSLSIAVLLVSVELSFVPFLTSGYSTPKSCQVNV